MSKNEMNPNNTPCKERVVLVGSCMSSAEIEKYKKFAGVLLYDSKPFKGSLNKATNKLLRALNKLEAKNLCSAHFLS